MKFTLKNSFVKQLIKEEALSLKKDLIESTSHSRLDEIKLKKAMIKTTINEMYESAELDEFFGMGKFSKAKKSYIAKHQNELAQMTQAYNAKDMAYVTISTDLVKNLKVDLQELIAEFHFTDRDDILTLKKTIMELIQPMTYKTFANQVQHGVSLSDIGAGASSSTAGL